MTASDAKPTGALSTRNVRFDELRLAVDHRLQIEIPSRSEPVHARLLGYLKGASLIVRVTGIPAGSGMPFGEGDTVVVRGFSGCIAFAFNSVVEKIRYAPYPYCHLRFPTVIRGAEIRKAVRVRVNLPVRVVNTRLGEDYTVEAHMTDISAAGAQLISALPLGLAGDHLQLSFRFWILPNDYEVNLNTTAVIQTAMPSEDAHLPGHQYGVRFEGLRSTETILLQNLVYQQLQENPGTRI